MRYVGCVNEWIKLYTHLHPNCIFEQQLGELSKPISLNLIEVNISDEEDLRYI